MQWTKADDEYLRELRKEIDHDDIRIKELIKNKLVNNKYIIKLLDNTELENAQAEPDEYFGVSILPYFLIKPTITSTQNFICIETDYSKLMTHDPTKKYQQIIFHILCAIENVIVPQTGLARHDMIAALILREFDHTNIFGAKIHCVSDKSSAIENLFCARTLVFEQITDNNLVKTSNGIPRLANKDVVI
jgi:hypothetical protein